MISSGILGSWGDDSARGVCMARYGSIAGWEMYDVGPAVYEIERITAAESHFPPGYRLVVSFRATPSEMTVGVHR